MKKRRLPAPWRAEKVEGGYRVKDDHGHWLAFVYAEEDHQAPKMPNYLTWDEARRVAKAIARLPELLQRRSEPHQRLGDIIEPVFQRVDGPASWSGRPRQP